MLQQRADVARVELARVERHRRGKIRQADERYAVTLDDLARLGRFRVASRLGRKVDDYRAWSHPGNRRCRNQLWRGPPGNERGRDHDVVVWDALRQLLLLLSLLLRRQFAGVPAGSFLAAHSELEERRAEALHLLLHDRAHVEAGHDCTE